jgi:hypothetical protein
MDTADIFVCEICALPVRNEAWAKGAGKSFTCKTCEICETDLRQEMTELEGKLHDMLFDVVKRLYRYHHGGSHPPAQFEAAIETELKKKNPAEARVEQIKKAIKEAIEAIAAGGSADRLIRHVIESEKLLSEFFHRSRERRFMARSPTVLRHWAALRKKLKKAMDDEPVDQESVLQKLTRDRYGLNLQRMSKLVGDNPVAISRQPAFYDAIRVPLRPDASGNRPPGRETRTRHLQYPPHINELATQTACMRPNITDDNIADLLRFAGNACLITEPDEMVEFRNSENHNLCKYLLKDKIMIVVNDFRCLRQPTTRPRGDRALAELVSIHPKRPAAGQLIDELASGRFLPNCVDLDELTDLSDRIEKAVSPRK